MALPDFQKNKWYEFTQDDPFTPLKQDKIKMLCIKIEDSTMTLYCLRYGKIKLKLLKKNIIHILL